jgi:pimeloyl-ACP methyl ester carboxylesterase
MEVPYSHVEHYDDLDEPVKLLRVEEERDVAYAIHGPHPFDGFTTFFMHGSPGCRIGPLPRGFALHRLGVRVVSFDRPGYGRSDRLTDRSVADTARDVEMLADHLGIEEFGVTGRSGGVAHALGTAALLGDRVQNAACLVGIAPPDTAFDRFAGMVSKNIELYEKAKQNVDMLALEYEGIAQKVAKNPYSFLDAFLWEQMSKEDQAVFHLWPPLRDLHANAYYEALVPQNGAGWVDDTLAVNKDWGLDLGKVKQPTLFWHGQEDVFSPHSNSTHMANRIREYGNNQVTSILEAGHGHFDVLHFFTRILAWQRDTAQGRRAFSPGTSII